MEGRTKLQGFNIMCSVLCVGGIADGEMRSIPYAELQHGATFAAHSDGVEELYRLHEFKMSSTLMVPNPNHVIVSRWLAAPAGWSTMELFDNFIAGYAQIHGVVG